jgi:hypothetical protein
MQDSYFTTLQDVQMVGNMVTLSWHAWHIQHANA